MSRQASFARAPDELDGNPFAMATRKMHWKSLDHFIGDD
jgi:hypothetical protein